MKIKTAKYLSLLLCAAMILPGCKPHVQPDAPSAGTTSPTVISTDPTQMPTHASTEATAAPTSSVQTPTTETQTPTAQTQTPTGSTQAPTQATQAPATTPLDPTDPTQASSAPTEVTQAATVAPTVPAATTAPTQATQISTEPSEAPLPPPEDLPPAVTIPPETDPETGEPEPIVFPCEVPGYGLVIEKIAPYSGMFVENGTNAMVENVAMLLIWNNGDFPVEYTQISIQYGEEKLVFDISALPVGEYLVVQEKHGKTIPSGDVTSVGATIVERADMEMSEGKVQVTDNGNNTLTIKNLTGETIPTVRVFYKYYMADEDIFVGGIAFTVRITRLSPGASVTIQPSHYASQTCRVVMVLTYDSEV